MNEIIYTPIFEASRVYREETAKEGALLVVKDRHGSFLPKITLAEAVQSSELSASFVFSNPPWKLENEEDAERLVAVCDAAVGLRRGIIWINGSSQTVMPLSEDASFLSDVFETQVSCSLWLIAQNRAALKLDEAAGRLTFSDFSPPLHFSNQHHSLQFISANVSLCGKNGGVFSFSVELLEGWFNDLFYCGFDYAFEDTDEAEKVISLPFWSFPPQNARMRFDLDPCDILKSSAVFEEQISFPISIKTIYGEQVTAHSAENGGIAMKPFPVSFSENIVSPRGCFSLSTASGGDITFLCGLSGTEYFTLKQGGIVEFQSGCPAFSSYFPQSEFSIGDFVNPPPSCLLNEKYVTSWMRVVGKYSSQPQEAPLFGGTNDLLAPADVSLSYGQKAPFVPFMPYHSFAGELSAHYASPKQTAEFEKLILLKTRGDLMGAAFHLREKSMGANALSGNTAATASGYIAELDGSGGFRKLAVAFSPIGELAFSNPPEAAASAFRNAGMFAVLANPQSVGSFDGKLSLEDWQFKLNIGAGSKYNDYANILIIKSTKGKLYDPDNPEKGLCANLDAWTNKELLSAPLTDGAPQPQPAQLANLSCWMLNYCKAAYEKRENACFAQLAAAISDENWQGFLALRVTLNSGSFPECLQGLLEGVNENEIYLHHIGSRITAVKPGTDGPVNDGFSPFFGSIYYEANGFAGKALPPKKLEADYSFGLLDMKVIFENGALKSFESISQFVLGSFLGMLPSTGSIPYNALLLNGTLQNNGGASTLSLSSNGGTLMFEQSPFDSLRVTNITMTSTNSKAKSFTFNISGSISFAAPQEGTDVFSYSSLVFACYAIQMNAGVFTIDLSQLSFDNEHSSARQNSLCRVFGLIPQSAMCFNSKSFPQTFRPLAGDEIKNGSFSGDSFGIVYSVALGSMGSLSDGSSLNAKILMSWGLEVSEHEAALIKYIGIELPGSALIENVIGLTLGDARLSFENSQLIMQISGIAIQALGMLKLPQSGALTLTLRGGDDGVGWFAAYKK